MKYGAHYQYKKRQVEGVDQGTLIIMLYDGAIKFLSLAVEAIEVNEVEDSHNNIVRGQAIINELMNSLKVDVGEIAVNLLRLYEFMERQLAEANAKKDPNLIVSVIDLLVSLREGWVEIIVKLKKESPSNKEEQDAEKSTKPINVAV